MRRAECEQARGNRDADGAVQREEGLKQQGRTEQEDKLKEEGFFLFKTYIHACRY